MWVRESHAPLATELGRSASIEADSRYTDDLPAKMVAMSPVRESAVRRRDGSMEEEFEVAGACGLYCGACEHYGVDCEGCGVQGGAPFWGECEIYRCCIEECGFEFCGECDDYPCAMYVEASEHPSFPPREELEESISRRLTVGTEAWLEEQSRHRTETS